MIWFTSKRTNANTQPNHIYLFLWVKAYVYNRLVVIQLLSTPTHAQQSAMVKPANVRLKCITACISSVYTWFILVFVSSKTIHFPKNRTNERVTNARTHTNKHNILPIQHSIISNDRHLFMVLHKYLCAVHLTSLSDFPSVTLCVYVFFLVLLWFVTIWQAHTNRILLPCLHLLLLFSLCGFLFRYILFVEY